MATLTEVENCYRYILGREMSSDEKIGVDQEQLGNRDLSELRREFLKSPEFHHAHLDTLFENLVPRSIPIAYESNLGFKIYLDLRQLHISFGILNDAYDRFEVDIARKVMPDDGLFVDVGANCGYYSLAVAAKENFQGKIMAFEPLTPVGQLLERSIAANGFSKKIELYPVALGHAAGVMPLTDAESSINAGATRLAVGMTSLATRRTTRVETLDTVMRDLTPDVIKIDIEGAEGLFFHGARETLQRAKPTLMFEVNPELLKLVSGLAPGDLQLWLQNFRYNLWTVEATGPVPVQVEQNIGEVIGQRGMINVLAVHADRMSTVSERVGAGLITNLRAAA